MPRSTSWSTSSTPGPRASFWKKRPQLDKIAEALLQYETIDGKHVLEILEFGEIRIAVAPPVITKTADLPPGRKPAEKAATGRSSRRHAGTGAVSGLSLAERWFHLRWVRYPETCFGLVGV